LAIERATALPLPRHLQSRLAALLATIIEAALPLSRRVISASDRLFELYDRAPGAGHHVNV
jgi:hypothetical protein